jgi:hypothetical protein
MKALIVLAFLLGACTHTVRGTKMKISITRAPTCKVTVDVDTKRVFIGTASRPCPKEK